MNPDSPQNSREELEVRITALLLGELPAEEAAALRETIARDPELARLHDRLKLAMELVREARPTPDLAEQAKPEPLTLAPKRRTKLLKLFKQPVAKIIKPPFPWRAHRRELLQLAAMVVGLLTVTGLVLFRMIRRDSEVYKHVLNGEDMPPVSTRIGLGLLRSIGVVEDESHPLLMMRKLGEVPQETTQARFSQLGATPSPAPSAGTDFRFNADFNRNALANGTFGNPQWIGVSGLITNSTVAIAPQRPNSGADTIRSMAREFDAKTADRSASKLPVVGLQTQDAERGEAAKRSPTTIALPQVADAYGAVADSRGQAAVGLAPMAPAGQAGGGGLSGGAGGFGGGGAGALWGKKNESFIVNNAWGYDPNLHIAAGPEPGVAAGARVEAFDASRFSRDAGGVWYANAPQGRPPESKERSAEAGPGGKPGSGREESLAVRELEELEHIQKKDAPVLGDLPMLGQLFRRDGKDGAAAVAGKPAAAANPSPAQLSAGDVLQVVTVPTEPPPVVGREFAQIEGVNRSDMSGRGAAPAGPAAQPHAPTTRSQVVQFGGGSYAAVQSGITVMRTNGMAGDVIVEYAAAPATPPPAPPRPTAPAVVPPPDLNPTGHAAFVAGTLRVPTDGLQPSAARKPDTDGDGVAAVKARSRLGEVPAKGLSDLQRTYSFAEGQPAMPTAGQRPNPLGRFGAITAPTADDSLALGVRTEPVQRGKGVTPSAAADKVDAWRKANEEFPQAEKLKAGKITTGESIESELTRLADRKASVEREMQYSRSKLDAASKQSGVAAAPGATDEAEKRKKEVVAWESRIKAAESELARIDGETGTVIKKLQKTYEEAAPAAAEARKPAAQMQLLKIELPSAGESDKEAKHVTAAGATESNRFVGRNAYLVLPQGESLQLDKLHNQAKQAESTRERAGVAGTNGRVAGPKTVGGDVQKLDEAEKKLAEKLMKAPEPVASAPDPRSSRRKEAQTSNPEIQDLKTKTDQSRLALSLASKSGTRVLIENEARRKLSEKEIDKAKAPAKPAAPAPIPQPEVSAAQNPFSTFSLNVSDVSFKLAAASLEKGVMPDVSTLRSEEFINAFDYHDPEPTGPAPVAFAWERARYPFAHDRDLLRFSVKTAASGRQPGRPLNLVLLLDNSGSMERADRVAIRGQCLRVLAGQLQAPDRVSVVAFARTARLWVDGLPGSRAAELPTRVGGLAPEGGTNLEDALNLAYRTALRHFLPHGVNRVVLLTDGAANLGDVDPASLKQKVEAHRQQGIALDCFGIGWEGYNDDLLEVLSRNGDGRYGFVNTPAAAATEFAGQLAGALQVAASDVKVQVEWNPRRVTVWRQIGYAKHQLKKEQFRDNTVDAAEIAAAEAGNALYTARVNPAGEGPLGTVRVRFRVPGTPDYREHEWPVPYEGASKPLAAASPALRLAAAGSAFSEWLASSPFAGEVTPDHLLGYLAGVPELYPADPRPKQLEWMIRQARSLAVR